MKIIIGIYKKGLVFCLRYVKNILEKFVRSAYFVQKLLIKTYASYDLKIYNGYLKRNY